ncbi:MULTISPECIES: hypothetical protein [unclassified Streptomyces]|uniref:hypothetical protein n=1 Tax=unclassified Streptomyces TaxID=2593676 RepID=UPI000BEF2AB8|nr:hypothetical protein [Streptomyces sp. wa1063]
MVSPRYMAGAGLRDATDRTRDLADGLDTVRPAFTAEPPARAAPSQPRIPSHKTPAQLRPPRQSAVAADLRRPNH